MGKLSKLVTGGPDLLPDCSNYDKNAYAKAANTVDVAVLRMVDGDLSVLLVKRLYEPFKGQWAIPGGFVDIAKEETLEQSSYRETEEETGAKDFKSDQLKTYGDPDRDPRDRVISTVFYSLVSSEDMDIEKLQAADDAEDLMWCPLRGTSDMDLAFDHNKILKDLAERLKLQVQYLPIAFNLLPILFTWGELQQVYECILGREVMNIRRKIRARYKISEHGKKEVSVSRRPPTLLRYDGDLNKF